MRYGVLCVFPLPAPVSQGHSEERTPEQDVGEGDGEKYPHLAGAILANSARDVGHKLGSPVSTLT